MKSTAALTEMDGRIFHELGGVTFVNLRLLLFLTGVHCDMSCLKPVELFAAWTSFESHMRTASGFEYAWQLART